MVSGVLGPRPLPPPPPPQQEEKNGHQPFIRAKLGGKLGMIMVSGVLCPPPPHKKKNGHQPFLLGHYLVRFITEHPTPPPPPSDFWVCHWWWHWWLTSALPRVQRVSRILCWSRCSMQGPVWLASIWPSSWVKITSMLSRWFGMLLSCTGCLSSRDEIKAQR